MARAAAVWPLMDDMGAIPMPGGWSLSTVWLPLCGQSWLAVWLHFTAMWAAMMVPMMLPALAPPLWRYHAALARSSLARRQALSKCVAAAIGWGVVWLMAGVALYPAGAMASQLLLQARRLSARVPILSVAAGSLGACWHLATWHARCTEVPRTAHSGVMAHAAWRHGVALGTHCVRACAGLMAALLAAGMMDWRVCAAGTALVLGERLFAALSIQIKNA